MKKGQRVKVKDFPIPNSGREGKVVEELPNGILPRSKVLLDGESNPLIFADKYLKEINPDTK